MKKQNKKKSCCSKANCSCKSAKKKNKKGFTLIEMMVVIIIIGILSAFIIMSVIGVRQKASASRAVAEIAQIKSIAEMANAEGCTQLTFALVNSGSGLKVSCSSGLTKDYTTIQSSPTGATYVLYLDATPDYSASPVVPAGTKTITSTSGGVWTLSGAGTLSLSSSPAFGFSATGFTSGRMTCLPSGCSCSVNGGCTTF